MFKLIQKLDNKILRVLYALNLHPKVNQFLRAFTRLGDGYIWGVPFVYILVFHSLEENLLALRAVSVCTVFSIVVYKTVKKKVKRKRPYNEFDHVVAQIAPLDEFSFPSGHTMNNLTPGIVVAIYYPELAPFTIGFPLTWGILRIYFGVHYFSDVIGGLILSALCVASGLFIDQFISMLMV